MTEINPVAWIVYPESRNFTRGIYENPTDEDFAIWKASGDIVEPLYDSAALAAAEIAGILLAPPCPPCC